MYTGSAKCVENIARKIVPVHTTAHARVSIFVDYIITTALRDSVTDYQSPPCPCDRNVTAVVALTTVSTGVTTPWILRLFRWLTAFLE